MTYIFMIDQLHQFEFPVGSFGVCDILEWPGQLLNGNILPTYCVVRRAKLQKQNSSLLVFLALAFDAIQFTKLTIKYTNSNYQTIP